MLPHFFSSYFRLRTGKTRAIICETSFFSSILEEEMYICLRKGSKYYVLFLVEDREDACYYL